MSGDRITIGKFSSLTYLSQRALRLYDRKGILVPGVRDRITGYRYYKINQIETALKIKTLCNLGFGLSDIVVILSAHDAGNHEAVRQFITRRRRETVAEIDRLEKITCLLMDNRDFSELFKMNVSKPVIKEVPATRILSGRRIGSFEEVCSQVSEELFAIIFSPANQRGGVTVTGPCMSLCYDDDTGRPMPISRWRYLFRGRSLLMTPPIVSGRFLQQRSFQSSTKAHMNMTVFRLLLRMLLILQRKKDMNLQGRTGSCTSIILMKHQPKNS